MKELGEIGYDTGLDERKFTLLRQMRKAPVTSARGRRVEMVRVRSTLSLRTRQEIKGAPEGPLDQDVRMSQIIGVGFTLW